MTPVFQSLIVISGRCINKRELLTVSMEKLVTGFLASKMSYRGRAAGVMLNAVRDLELGISETEIARAAGLEKKSTTVNANVIAALLKDSKSLERK